MSASATETFSTLPEAEWRALEAAHQARVDTWIGSHQQRAARGEKQPVFDFLFSYYSFRPAWLRRWHPGPDVILAGDGARAFLRWPVYRETGDGRGVIVDPTRLEPKRREFVVWLRGLLAAMHERPAFYGCYALHEWAMVYRQTPEEVRHNALPLRFPPDEIARIVESTAICCTHFDAFRFFTPPARPLNRHQPTRETTPLLEQRGCLHANMDLYKWCYKLAPFTPAALTADCFALARDIREIDMRASPYDVRALGYPPIAVETPAGRAEFEQYQRTFSARGEPLRARLIALCDRLLGADTGMSTA